MKKLLFLLLLLPVMASATDILFVDTTIAADTVATAINVDTVWTAAERIDGASRLQFFYRIQPATYYTKFTWTADTFYVYYQHSFDKEVWRNILLGKSIDTATVWSGNYSAADSLFGNYGRYMVIHRDSAEADRPDSLSIVRGVKYFFNKSIIK